MNDQDKTKVQLIKELHELQQEICSLRTSLQQSVSTQTPKIHYDMIVEKASDGFWLLDKEFNTVFVNPALEEMLGYTLEEMLGRNWYDFGDNESVELAKELQKRREIGIVEAHEFMFIHKDGRKIMTRIATTPLYDKDGNFDGAIGVLSDISSHKNALQKSEERYKMLINTVLSPIVISTFNGKVVFVNQAAEDFFGVSFDEIDNLSSIDFWTTPSQREEFVSQLKENGVVNNIEIEYTTKKNGLRDTVLSSTIVDYCDDKAILSILNDITERKKAEEALKDSEGKYRYLVDNAPIGIFQRSIKGGFNFCNLTLAKQFECNSIDEFLLNYNDISKRWASHEQFVEFNELLLKNGEVLGFENKVRLINGKTKWFGLYFKLDSTKTILDGFSLDITERKFAERALNSLATNFAGLSGKAFFEAISKHIATEMGIDYVYVGELTDTKDAVRVLGGFALGEAMGEMLYNLSDTPCSDLIKNDTCLYPTGIQQLYPKDHLLQQMGIDSYLGSRIYNKEEEPIGLLVALHSKPINNPDILSNLFSIFLDRIAAELHRMHAYEALHKNEAIQRKMVSNIGDVIVIIDKNGINRYKSVNIEKWFGWKPEELVGKSTWDTIHPEDLLIGQDFLGSIMSEPNSSGTIELRYRKKDDSYSWIEITIVNLLHDPDINGLLGNYHDISERKKAEQVIQKKIEDLQWHFDIAIQRELKMGELKKEMNELLVKTGQEKKYNT